MTVVQTMDGHNYGGIHQVEIFMRKCHSNLSTFVTVGHIALVPRMKQQIYSGITTAIKWEQDYVLHSAERLVIKGMTE